MSRSDALTTAVQAVDLPSLMADMFPESKAVPGRAGVYFAAWRGNASTPAVSVSRKGTTWLWSDKATGEGGNAFDFLAGPGQMGRQEAAHHLLAMAGLAEAPGAGDSLHSDFRPIPPEAYKAFGNAVIAPIKAMSGRGFNKPLLEKYRIIPAPDNADDALIPITSPHGVILQVKRRYGTPNGKQKYGYEHKGYGGPPWCSLDSHKHAELFIIEGELNGIIAHASMEEAGEVGFGVMGVAGAEAALYDGICHGKHVFIYADSDEAGARALARWTDEARLQGARSVWTLPAQPMDFCDYAGKHGRTALSEVMRGLRSMATQVYGAMDRMVGSYSVRQLTDSAARYISGSIIHPTGFAQVDKETGGIRESGLFGVGGLPSMGKSSLIRRILIENVRRGGKVKVYSPDQSPHAIYRLLTSLLTDVGVREARTRRFHRDVLNRYGSEDAAIKAWHDMYTYVILELSQRFQVSEESALREISKDMHRAVDQGITMFGVDFLQLLEPDGAEKKDGEAAKQLQKVAAELGRPVICGLQLAKYKFPPTRHSGIPVLTDIEGSGAYQQSAEMMFMVFNEEIYANKYGGPDYEFLGDAPGYARLLLRKDKEGDGDMEFGMSWVGRLAALKDKRPQTVEQEQEGLV